MKKIPEYEVWREGGIFGEEIRIVCTGDYERGSAGSFDEPAYAEGFVIGSATAHATATKRVWDFKLARTVTKETDIEFDILSYLEADDAEYESIAQEIIENHFSAADDDRIDWAYEQAKDRKLENRE